MISLSVLIACARLAAPEDSTVLAYSGFTAGKRHFRSPSDAMSPSIAWANPDGNAKVITGLGIWHKT
jgi:hypothetical protein